jgi:hypothetical protein
MGNSFGWNVKHFKDFYENWTSFELMLMRATKTSISKLEECQCQSQVLVSIAKIDTRMFATIWLLGIPILI